jgi:hypothetical protein
LAKKHFHGSASLLWKETLNVSKWNRIKRVENGLESCVLRRFC